MAILDRTNFFVKETFFSYFLKFLKSLQAGLELETRVTTSPTLNEISSIKF